MGQIPRLWLRLISCFGRLLPLEPERLVGLALTYKEQERAWSKWTAGELVAPDRPTIMNASRRWIHVRLHVRPTIRPLWRSYLRALHQYTRQNAPT